MDEEKQTSDDEANREADSPKEPEGESKPNEPRHDGPTARAEHGEIEQAHDSEVAGNPTDDFQINELACGQVTLNQTGESGVDADAPGISLNDEPASDDDRAAEDAISAAEEEAALAVPPDALLVDPATQTAASETAAPSWSGADVSTFDTMFDVADEASDEGGDERLEPQMDDGPTSRQSAESHVAWAVSEFGQFDAAAIDPEFSRGGSDDSQIEEGIVTSIKSIDLLAKTYRDPAAITRLGQAFVDKVAGFKGATRAKSEILQHEIKGRALDLVVPRGATTTQRQALEGVKSYGLSKGVSVQVLEVER